MKHARMIKCAGILAMAIGAHAISAGTVFTQTNLVVDSKPPEGNTADGKLINPWGLAVGPTGIFWASNQGTNTSTLYDSAGNKNQLEVNIPQKKQAPQGNTGVIFNGSSDFEVSPNNPAKFIFVGLDGSISGWNPNANATNAITKKDNSASAVYTGVAMGNSGGNNFFYTANRASGTVDVFDKTFTAASLSGNFSDPNVSSNLKPFNVVTLGNKVYVTYATNQGDPDKVDEGSGAVSVFDTSGNLLKHLIDGGHLASPWGVAVAPSSFGDFANALLVGNFNEDGHINAFDPNTGKFLGTLKDKNGNAISNEELWSLIPGVGADSDTLFFTSGNHDETGGIFGKITAGESGGGNAVPLPNMVYISTTMLAGSMLLVSRRRLRMRVL